MIVYLSCLILKTISSVQAQKLSGQARAEWHIITIAACRYRCFFLLVVFIHSSLSPQLQGSAIQIAAMELHISALYICSGRFGVSVGSTFHIY